MSCWLGTLEEVLLGPSECAAIQSLLSDTVLDRLNMFRDDEGRAVRRGSIFAQFVNSSDPS